MRRSCVKLPGLFRSENWTTLVLQASTKEPSIRHAVLALASAHQEEVKGASSLFYKPNDDQSRLTVYQYGKAITALQPSLSDFQSSSLRIALITCAFFVYSDFLLGHYKRGLVHLRHGLNLVPSLGVNASEHDPSSTLVDGWIVTILTRLLVQAKLLGQQLRTPCQDLLDPGLQSHHDTFRSIHHARRSLEHIFLQVFHLEEEALQQEALQQSQMETTVTTSDLFNRQKIAQLQLQKWHQILLTTIDSLPEKKNMQSFIERFVYQLLQLYHRLAIIFADTCIEASNERRFDRHETIFLGIVTKSIEIQNITHPNGKLNPRGFHDPEPSSPNSISDIGWIPPLYLTAIKCRNHRLRHQAVKLLASSSHREGIWDSNLAVAVAQRVIEIEEGDFYDHLTGLKFDKIDFPADTDLATPTLPEQSRLRIVDLILPEDRSGRLRLRCLRKVNSIDYEWIDQEFDLCTRRWTDTQHHLARGSISSQ
ncbi:hypothetical protein DV737_g2809, partial [Chaetothyriales sp. CBS 132003]